MVTADKNVVASLYTTADDTEIGDAASTSLLGLCTRSDGGSDSFYGSVIHASHGIYAEILENSAGSTDDAAILTVSYVDAANYADAFAKVSAWRSKRWDEAEGREGTGYLSNFHLDLDLSSNGPDGGDGSGTGGGTLEASSRVFVTDEILSNLNTGVRD